MFTCPASAAEQAEEETIFYDSLTDYQYTYNCGLNTQCVTKAEDGYYIKLGGILFYADDSLDFAFPLCSKPECLHGEEPTLVGRSGCDAFVGEADITAIQYTEGVLYTASSWDLNRRFPDEDSLQSFYRISEDGTKKERLELEEGIIWTPVVHRGYVYYLCETYETEKAGQVKTIVTLYRNSLSENEKEVLWQSDEGINRFSGLQAYGERLYYSCGTDSWSATIVFDLETGGYHTLDPFAGEQFTFSFHEGKLLLSRKDLTRKCPENRTVYVADLDGENVEELTVLEEINEDCAFLYAGDYLVSDNALTWSVAVEGGAHILRVYDGQSFELAAKINLSGEELEEGESAAGSLCFPDEDYIFYLTTTADGRENLRYYSLEEIASGEAESHLLATSSSYGHGYKIEDGQLKP